MARPKKGQLKQNLTGTGKKPVAGGQHSASSTDDGERSILEREGEQGHPPTADSAETSSVHATPAGLAPVPTSIGNKLAGKFQARTINIKSLPPHVVVEARAGTGKTTTLIEGLKRLKGLVTTITPSPQQKAVWDALELSKDARTVCFVAFNKSIAAELASRVPAGCEAKTMHGMGFGAVRKQFGGSIGVNEHRVTEIIARLMDYTDLKALRKDHGPLLGVVQRLVGLCKMNLTTAEDPEEIAALVSHYDIETEGVRMERVYDLVPQVLAECLDVAKDRCIDFDDMVWLPVALDLQVFKFDLLLIDERQDLNKCQMQLALKAGHRIVAVGDEAQSIYGFAGADAQACKNFEAMLAATGRPVVKLPLTVTRRCGRAIVKEANKIVPDFQAHESNGDGHIRRMKMEGKSFQSHMKTCVCTELGQDNDECPAHDWSEVSYHGFANDGDMILCRANAPLVSQCFKFIRMGRKATIQGRDIGQGLISLIRKLGKDDPSVANLGAAIDDWRMKQREREQSRRNPSDTKLQAIDDKADCLTVLCEEAETVDAVVRKIEAIFTDNKDAVGLKLSSIHKAKGLEAHRVFLLQPEGAEVLPAWLAKKPAWEQQQARNLLYVAVTRAIQELVHVS